PRPLPVRGPPVPEKPWANPPASAASISSPPRRARGPATPNATASSRTRSSEKRDPSAAVDTPLELTFLLPQALQEPARDVVLSPADPRPLDARDVGRVRD